MKNNEKPLLIFDYDGTLHHTIEIYEPAVKTVYQGLVEEGLVPPQELKRERIAGWLGMNSQEMWEDLAGNLSLSRREVAAKEVAKQMQKQIEMGHARWYPGAREVLDQLRQDGYPMVILSNCSTVYREANWKEFGLDQWFRKFYDCESYKFAPKTEIIKTVLVEQTDETKQTTERKVSPESESMEQRQQYNKDNGVKAVMIGDRVSDLAAARAAGICFIGCEYGFGMENELADSDALLEDVRELPEKLRQLS